MSSARILNVDDYGPARYARTRLLRAAGFLVTEAESVKAALRALEDQDVSLVVLDMNLPDGTGADLCRKIRSQNSTSALPVLMISATARGELDRLEGVQSGANMYLTEPVSPTLFVSTIDHLLNADGSSRQV
jgi:DNA-binding response OmpR family regulator